MTNCDLGFLISDGRWETSDHLETLWDTKSLTNQNTFDEISELLDHLARKLNRYIQPVESQHNRTAEDSPDYSA